MMFAGIWVKVILYAVVAASLAGLGWGARGVLADRNERGMKLEWANERHAAAEKALKSEKDRRDAEAALRETADAEREARDVALRGIATSFERLSKYITTSRTPLKDAGAAPAQCKEYAAPPTQLSVLHATMVAELARAADEAVLDRNTCYAQYDAARQAIKDFNANHILN